MHDESDAVVVLGGVHIEIAAFKALGKWALGIRWPRALGNTRVAATEARG